MDWSRGQAILIEGCDGAGKSTLARHLRQALPDGGWDLVSMGHRPGDQCRRYMVAYSSANRTIFDRGHFSEVVYGDLWRKGEHFTNAELLFLNEYVLSRFVVILALAPPDTLRERWRLRGEQKIREGELLEVQQRFESLMTDKRVIRYDSTVGPSIEMVTAEAIQRLGTPP